MRAVCKNYASGKGMQDMMTKKNAINIYTER